MSPTSTIIAATVALDGSTPEWVEEVIGKVQTDQWEPGGDVDTDETIRVLVMVAVDDEAIRMARA